MRKAKRKISTLLILCMFVSMLPASVAADNSEQLAASVEPAVDSPTVAAADDGSGSSGSEDLIALTADEVEVSTASDVPGPVTLAGKTDPSLGTDVQWEFENNTLTISGTGAMLKNFNDPDVPWTSDKGKIKEIVIESGITSSAGFEFTGYSALSSLTVPDNVSIAEDAFTGCGKLTSVTFSNKWKYSNGELTILPGVGTASSSWAALKDRVTKVVIEAGVSGIAADAFNDMTKLSDSGGIPAVDYKGQVTDWSSSVCGGADDKKGLKVDDRYLTVNCLDSNNNGSAAGLLGVCGIKDAQTNTESFVTFLFEERTKTLTISGEGTISNFKDSTMPWYTVRGKIENFVIPATVTGIGDYAFYSCSALTSVTIPKDIVSIGTCAFAKCDKLATLNISKEGDPLEIGPYAFWECKSLENIGPSTTGQNAKMNLPTRVKKIGEAAFRATGLVYKPGGTTGHIYYAGDSNQWKAINGDGGSPNIRDGKLLTGATNYDENTYAFVHCLAADNTTLLYHNLTFKSGSPYATGTGPVRANIKADSSIVDLTAAIKPPDNGSEAVGKVAEDTTLKLPEECGFTRDGYKFDGWLCDADNEVYKTNEIFIMPAKDVTFTARWTPNTPTQGSEIAQIIEKLEKQTWEVPQDSASSQIELSAWLYKKETSDTNACTVKKVLDKALEEAKDPTITASYRLQLTYFRPAVMGISNMTKGQNGQFQFKLHLTFKQNNEVFMATATITDGVIKAIAYDKEKDKKYKVTFKFTEGSMPKPNAPNYGYTIIEDTMVTWPEMRAGQTFLMPTLKHDTKEFDRWKCEIKGSFVEELTFRPGTQFMMRTADVTFTPEWKEEPGSNDPAAIQAKLSNWEPLVSAELAAGKKASVTLKTAPVDTNSPEAARLKAASLEENMTFLDLTLSKTVDGETSAITDTNGTLVAVTVPFDGKNATNVKVYRDHDGEVDVLTEGGSGERIAVTNDSLTIYAGKFSVYAIAFDRKTSGSGASGSGTGGSGSSGGSGGSSSKPSIISHGTPTSNPATDSSVPVKKRFNDVPPDAWYYEAANWAYDQKIAKGEGGKRFNPNKLCTRAEMLTFLWRALGSPQPSGTGKTFTDVSSGSYYAKAVQWAAGQKIVKGEGGKRFNPDAPITRGEAITLLYRAIGVPASAGTRFKDVPESAYYAEAVEWAVSRDIAKGMGSRSFSPASPCTRAQVLTFLYRSRS